MGTLKNHILFINISLEIINITNLYKIKQNNIYYNSYTVYHMPVVIVVQSLSHVQLFTTPWTAAHQASLSFTISQSLFKFLSIELVMLSNHLPPHRERKKERTSPATLCEPPDQAVPEANSPFLYVTQSISILHKAIFKGSKPNSKKNSDKCSQQ